MKIHVKTLTGKTINLLLKDDYETVENVKQKIQECERISVDQQQLIYAGRRLIEGDSLYEYNIQEGDVIHLVLRLGHGDTLQNYIVSIFPLQSAKNVELETPIFVRFRKHDSNVQNITRIDTNTFFDVTADGNSLYAFTKQLCYEIKSLNS